MPDTHGTPTGTRVSLAPSLGMSVSGKPARALIVAKALIISFSVGEGRRSSAERRTGRPLKCHIGVGDSSE